MGRILLVRSRVSQTRQGSRFAAMERKGGGVLQQATPAIVANATPSPGLFAGKLLHDGPDPARGIGLVALGARDRDDQSPPAMESESTLQ